MNAEADYITLHDEEPLSAEEIFFHPQKRRIICDKLSDFEQLLADIIENGELVCDLPDNEDMRKCRTLDMERFGRGVNQLMNPHVYQVSLSQLLWEQKQHSYIKHLVNPDDYS